MTDAYCCCFGAYVACISSRRTLESRSFVTFDRTESNMQRIIAAI